MSFAFYRLFARFVAVTVFAVLCQATHATTLESGRLIPEPAPGTAYLLPISRALDESDFARAESLVRARIDTAPEDALAWEVLGVTLALGGDPVGADDAYAKAVTFDPKRLSAWVKRGDLAEATGRVRDAVIYWTAALEVAPTYTPAHLRLGSAYAEAGDLARAVLHLEAVVAVEDAADLVTRTELALVYNRVGRPGDTLALFEDADAIEETDVVEEPRLMLALGNAHAQLGDIENALAQYQRGIDALPDNNALLRAKGALLVETGAAGSAVVLLARPAGAEPVDAFANLQYARALLATGKPSDAAVAAERAIGASTTTDISRQSLSVAARAYLLDRDFAAATETTGRLVALLPDDADAWREHAGIHGATGQYQAAKDIYDQALVRFEGNAELLRGRSVVNVRLNLLEEAAEDALLAAEAAPDWLEPRFMLGEIEQARGLNDKAEDAFRTALTIDPAHWPSLVSLANLRLAVGDAAEAVTLAQQAVTLSGGAETATDILEKAQARQ